MIKLKGEMHYNIQSRKNLIVYVLLTDAGQLKRPVGKLCLSVQALKMPLFLQNSDSDVRSL